jgi:hypothetical protein
MSVSPPIAAALHTLQAILADLSIPWMITGSAAGALHGVPMKPLNVDVETDERGAYAIERRLGDLVIEPITRRSEEAGISSSFGRFVTEGVTIEVMGGMRVRDPEGAWCGPYAIEDRVVTIDFEGAPLPVVSLEALEQLYTQLGWEEQASTVRAFRSKPTQVR